MDEQPHVVRDGFVAGTLSAAGAALEVHAPGLSVLAAGGTAAMAPAVAEVLSRIWAKCQRRQAEVLDTAASAADLSVEAIVQEAERSELTEELLVAVMENAWKATARRKRLALGRTLAEGLKADAKVEAEILIARAIAELDSGHVEVLQKLTVPRGEVIRHEIIGPPAGFTYSELSGMLPHLQPILEPLLGGLSRNGLVTGKPTDLNWGVNGPTMVDTVWIVTDQGHTLLERLGE